MTEKKSGPVKPPIIDAKARAADPAAATAETEPKKSTPEAASAPPEATARPEVEAGPSAAGGEPAQAGPDMVSPDGSEPKPETGEALSPPLAEQRLPVGALVAVGVGGAVLGAVAAYGLALAGLWPQTGAGGAVVDQGALEARIAQVDGALASQQGESAAALARIAALEDALESVQTDIESPELPDFSTFAPAEAVAGLEAELDALGARIDAVASGASGEEATALGDGLAALSTETETLAGRLDGLAAELGALGPALAAIEARVDDLDARLADQSDFEALSAERDQAISLSGALADLEAAIASGGPFTRPLAVVEAALPDLAIDAAAREAAARGVETPAALRARFTAAIPAILAARPADPQANWAQNLFDQAAAAIALRPTEGEGHQALVGQTEAALEAGDLAAAQAAFSALPDAMRGAAPDFAQALDGALAARDLVALVRDGGTGAEVLP